GWAGAIPSRNSYFSRVRACGGSFQSKKSSDTLRCRVRDLFCPAAGERVACFGIDYFRVCGAGAAWRGAIVQWAGEPRDAAAPGAGRALRGFGGMGITHFSRAEIG